MKDEIEEDDKAWSQELAVQKAEWERERKARPQTKGHLELIARVECLKNQWYVWSCELDGVPGSIQADWHGILIAHETFEKDE